MNNLYVLGKFINDPSIKNSWLKFKNISCYMRKEYELGRKKLKLIHIASIEVQCNKRGIGLFTTFLAMVEYLGFDVFIENVYEKRFQKFIENKGYTLFRNYIGTANSYIKYANKK